MTGELSAWDRVSDTRNPDNETRTISRRMPFGMLKRLDISWSAEGSDDSGTFFTINVTEHQPYGVVGSVIESQTSMEVVLSQEGPGSNGSDPTKTTYLAELVDGDVVSVRGSNAADQPYAIASARAAEGFDRAMADARFA